MAKKQQVTQKDIKAQIKELEEKTFGLKNKKQKAALEKQIEALRIKDNELKKNKIKKDMKQPIIQKIPVGVDPKTVQCINYVNKCCNEGLNCRFAHDTVKKVEKISIIEKNEPKHVCRFLIDALNNKEYSANWKCPFSKCSDIHKLIDLKGDTSAELSLEEYLELSRQSLGDNLTPLTEENFKIWKEKKIKEEIEHQKKIEAVASGQKGIELFENSPDMFMDDDAAVELNYNERCYSEDEDEELISAL